MMKIEYFVDGSDECPLILIYGQDAVGALNLRLAFERLSIGLIDEIAVHEIPGYESVDGCKLFAKVGRSDIGVRHVGEGLEFECILSKDNWLNIAGLLEPFADETKDSGSYSFQYLDETSEISLLISTRRAW